MSLTFSDGPLSGRPPERVNYRIEGPAHKLLMHDFPRRIRASFGGQTVVDTTRAVLLHETGLSPRLYVPIDDIRADLIRPTDHHTYCPFKGTASYWTVTVGDQVAENAIWAYPEPNAESSWLQGYAGFYWEAMDEWYDEDERLEGRLRDPYHRVDVRRSSRPVRVLLGDTVLAETSRPLLLSEDRPAEPLLPPGHRRPAGSARAQRHAHRLPVQGHRLLLVRNHERPQAHRRRLVLSAGRGRLGRSQRVPVLPARRPDRRSGRARSIATWASPEHSSAARSPDRSACIRKVRRATR
jgi:uncharacterized protein (DUF427 family)